MNRFVSFSACVGAWAASAVAQAQGSTAPVTLRWSAPDECPDDAQFVHQIETLLGQSLLEPRGQALSVRASAQGDPERGYAGKISFTGAQGSEERFLDHPRCDKLMEAMAMVIALAVDPERVRTTQGASEVGSASAAVPGESPPSPAPQVRPTPVFSAPPPRVPEAVREATSRSRRPLRGLGVALHALAGAGSSPGFGGGVQATAGWRREGFRLDLLGRYWAPREQMISVVPAARLEVELSTLGARAPDVLWMPYPLRI